VHLGVLAYSTGGSQIYRCGAGARALCNGVNAPGGLTGKPAETVAEACRKAGLPSAEPKMGAVTDAAEFRAQFPVFERAPTSTPAPRGHCRGGPPRWSGSGSTPS